MIGLYNSPLDKTMVLYMPSHQTHNKTQKTVDYTQGLQHWHSQVGEQGILYLALDLVQQRNNVLSQAVLAELEQLIDRLEQDIPAAIILYSEKASGFIFGADITEFSQLSNQAQALEYVKRVQHLFARWEQLACNTVAMIDGYCLGGGCELALACTYRVATRRMQTKVGLPEVKLGIIPGWGGSVRLPRLIGARRALPLLLAGKLLSAKAAARCGLLDAAVSQSQLKMAARYYALLPSDRKRQTAVKQRNLLDHLFQLYPLRIMMASFISKRLHTKINPKHYPASYALLMNWRSYAVNSPDAYSAEAKTVADLMCHPSSRNLVRVFFLQQTLKKLEHAKDMTIQHVHVVGAGVMGGDIAAWCALRGLQVTLQDTEYSKVLPAYQRALKLFRKHLPKKYLRQRAADRFIVDVVGDGMAKADVIIEAIYEDLSAKKHILQRAIDVSKPDAVIATNTSSLAIEDIAASLSQPQRLVGIHFFNPVAKMPLVEVVSGKQTAAQAQQAAVAFVLKIKKLPLPVVSCPGFLVNRVLMPYLLEAVYLLQQGFSAHEIDAAACAKGMPMGPITLADSVGLDICLAVAKNLDQAQQDRIGILHDLVAAGDLGKKSGRGFYVYRKLQRSPVRKPLNPAVKGLEKTMPKIQCEDIGDRMWYRLLNECVACWGQHVVADADVLDAGLIFGCGFPPYVGGPIHYIQQQGVDACLQRLLQLEQRYGNDFHPADAWSQLKD